MARIIGLNHFQIKGNGSPKDQQECKVYKNGIQQFQVDIVIEAHAAGQVIVPLTEAQLQSVRLIHYDNGANVESFFFRSYTKNKYDFYPESPLPDTASLKQNMSTITFYLALPSATNFNTLQIAAEIELDGAIYRTNAREADGGGHSNNGGFNSSLIVKPEAPYILRAANFNIAKGSKLATIDYPGYTGGNRVLILWTISLPGYRILGSDLSDNDPTPWFSQYVQSQNDLNTGHFALPISPANSTIHLGWQRNGESTSKDPLIMPYLRNGDAYAVIEESHSFQIHDYKPKQIAYYDNNGCKHSIVLRPNNNGTTFQIEDI